MKIALVTASRPHAGGMVGFSNTFLYGSKKLGHFADVISIFETTAEYRKKMDRVDSKLGNVLENKDWLNFLAWQTIKVIIFLRFFKNYLHKKYDFVYVVDVLCANAIRPLEKIFKIPVITNPIDSAYSVLASKKMAKPGGWFMNYIIRQERKTYLKAKAMLSNGLDMEEYYQRIAREDLKIPVMENPIDERNYYVDPAEGERVKEKYELENKFIVLYIGRLSPEKGIIYLLRSLEYILKKEPSTNIFIATGGAAGSEKQNLINYIKENNYEKYAKVLGYIEDEDMRGIYNMCSVLCAPSVNFEGETIKYLAENKNKKKIEFTISTTTTTIQEAFACGKTAIGTNIPGNREIIKENIDGLLVPEKNSEAIANAILKLKNNPELRKKLSNEALESVKERFFSTTVIEFLIDYYKVMFEK